MTAQEDFLVDEREKLLRQLENTRRQLKQANETVTLLEDVTHRAAKIAQHIVFLCATMPEHSPGVEQAAAQLQTLLVHRKT